MYLKSHDNIYDLWYSNQDWVKNLGANRETKCEGFNAYICQVHPHMNKWMHYRTDVQSLQYTDNTMKKMALKPLYRYK